MVVGTPLTSVAANGDAKRGERVFQFCFACHSTDPNEAAKLQGPNLARIVGRRAGVVAAFEYSDAMRAKSAEGLVWTIEMLDRYVLEPEAMVPGGRMSYPGMKDAADRADLIAYLMAKSQAQ